MTATKTALVTLVTGDAYRRDFDARYLPGWKIYCRSHGFDLIVIDRPIDPTVDLTRKSIHWQKLLAPCLPDLADHDRVVWVDGDIMINPAIAPDITAGIPEDRIGVVDATPWMTEPDDVINHYARFLLLDHLSMSKKRVRGIDYDRIVVADMSIADMYRLKGFDPPVDRYVNTGVFVCSPRHHRDFLIETYGRYDADRWDFENTAFSYELMRNDLAAWLDPRFNVVWWWHAAKYYPFLFDADRLRDEPGLTRLCINTAYRNSFFLHLAGRTAKLLAGAIAANAANIAELAIGNYAEGMAGISLLSCAEAERMMAERSDGEQVKWSF